MLLACGIAVNIGYVTSGTKSLALANHVPESHFAIRKKVSVAPPITEEAHEGPAQDKRPRKKRKPPLA